MAPRPQLHAGLSQLHRGPLQRLPLCRAHGALRRQFYLPVLPAVARRRLAAVHPPAVPGPAARRRRRGHVEDIAPLPGKWNRI